MKRLLIILIILSISLYPSCSQTNEIQDIHEKPNISIMPGEMEPATIPVLVESVPSEEKALVINKILKDKYNIEIAYNKSEDITADVISKFDGLIFTTHTKFLELFPKRKEIMFPMTEYLADIEEWDFLPNRYQNAFTQFDGENWAIPAYDRAFNLFELRAYNGEMLSISQTGLPRTPNELQQLLYEVKEKYPEIKPMLVSNHSFLYNCSDILNAFSVPVYSFSDYFSQIVFDENTNKYIDIVTESNFLKAISYIRDLVASDLMTINDFNNRTILKLFNSGQVFTHFWIPPYDDTVISEDFNTIYGNYLLGDGCELPNIYINSSFWVVILGGSTKEPHKLLQSFITSFYNNQEGIRDASYGLQELLDYEFTDDNNVSYKEKMNINFLPLFLDGLLDNPEHVELLNNEQTQDNWLIIREDYIKQLPNPDMLRANDFYHTFIETYSTRKETMYKSLESLVLKYIESTMTDEEFIDQYISTMKSIGAEETINEYNSALGLTDFHYEGN